MKSRGMVDIARRPDRAAKDARRLFGLLLLCCLLVAAALWSVAMGSTRIPIVSVWNALSSFDGSREHLLVMLIRLPRMLAAVLAGSALAVSGAIMQAITNNPLASPGLLGINAGASFAVVLVMTLFGAGVEGTLIWFAFVGASLSALLVHVLGSLGPGGQSATGIVIAGAIVATFLTSLTSAVLIFDQNTLDAVRLWTAGSVSGRTMAQNASVAPYILIGLFAGLFLARHLAILTLGREAARALGQNQAVWRTASIVVIVLLAGGAVSLAGPIGFVGLVVPHIVRLAIGIDYRWILPFSAVGGALLVVVADLAGRIIFGSQDFPVGVTTALIGAPFFLWLARNRAGHSA